MSAIFTIVNSQSNVERIVHIAFLFCYMYVFNRASGYERTRAF